MPNRKGVDASGNNPCRKGIHTTQVKEHDLVIALRSEADSGNIA
jgi:hypothetical protein